MADDDNQPPRGGSPLIAISGSVGGVSAVIVLIIAVFDSARLWVAAPIVGILALMGVILGALSRRKGG
jgi:hypothetical protein